MSTVDADAMLEAARRAARAACELLADARVERIASKSNPRDLVTEWDGRSEQCIRAALASHAPGVPVLGEEGGEGDEPQLGGRSPMIEAAARSPARWLVDPIDGTVNFAHGLPLWAISIGLEWHGELVVGVVAAPAFGWWFEATRGGGAYRYPIERTGAPRAAPQRLAVSGIQRLADALLVTGFAYDLDPSRNANNFARWEHMMRHASSCRRLGAAALDLCMVATGWLDGYWEQRLHAWDLAAGGLIAAEAGGRVTSVTGQPFDPHSGDVLASNGAIHEELIAELARSHRS